MHKDKRAKLTNYYVILSIITILGAGLWTAYGHFAKTSALEVVAKTMIEGQKAAAKSFAWVEERLAIGAHDDRVQRQEEEVTRAKNRLRFERKQGLPTREEEEDVAVQEKRLEDAVKKRQELIEQYKVKD